jgi:DNA-directed RNA polymerase specialized sigma24 family protein
MHSLPEVQRLARYKSPAELRADDKPAILRAMIRLLPGDQWRLAEMVMLNHVSHRAAAVSLQVVPGVVTRRVHSIRNRLACPVRRALFLHLEELPEPTRAIAVEHFYAGVSKATLAKTFDLPVREIQAHLDYVRFWIRALRLRRSKTPSISDDSTRNGQRAAYA